MPDLVVMNINGVQSLRIDYIGPGSTPILGIVVQRIAISDAEASLGLAKLKILYEGGAFKEHPVKSSGRVSLPDGRAYRGFCGVSPVDDFKPQFPKGGHRPWTARRAGNYIALTIGLVCLLAVMLIAFSEITHQVPFVDWSTP